MTNLQLFEKVVAAIEGQDVLLFYIDPLTNYKRAITGTLISPKAGVQGILHEESGKILHHFYTSEVKSVVIFDDELMVTIGLKDPADEEV
jgi:hypothetical protein